MICLRACNGNTTAERPGGSCPEEPRDTAAADPRLGGPSSGATGRAPLCGVRPQEGRLSGRILTATSGPPLLLQVWTRPPRRHSDGATIQKGAFKED